MPNDLDQFVKEALEKGASRSKITDTLLKAGWRQDEVSNALEQYLDVDFPVPVPRRRPYLSAREAFLYLLMFFTLYTSAISVGTILFQLINRWLPDPLQMDYIDSITQTIRFATASLVIAFPIFLFISWLLAKGIQRDPEKRGSRVRKWLTYITLFVAAGIIIGDLISLVFSLLNGELTLRFDLKVLVIALIAGTIFGYYLWDLRKEEKTV